MANDKCVYQKNNIFIVIIIINILIITIMMTIVL